MSAAEQITYIGLRIQSREELIEYLARVQKAFAFENVLEPVLRPMPKCLKRN